MTEVKESYKDSQPKNRPNYKWGTNDHLPMHLEREKGSTKIGPAKRILHKIGRNDPCYCGSGKKFKKCCVDFKGFAATCQKNTKGIKGKNCNREDCQEPGAFWFNHSTEKYYCGKCAEMINDANFRESMAIHGHQLCTLHDDFKNVKNIEES